MSTYEFSASSWSNASGPFSEVAASVSGVLGSTIASTTDANAIGSASGISLFDTAVTGVLAGLAQVLGELGDSLAEGLESESAALISTGQAYRAIEDNNTVTEVN